MAKYPNKSIIGGLIFIIGITNSSIGLANTDWKGVFKDAVSIVAGSVLNQVVATSCPMPASDFVRQVNEASLELNKAYKNSLYSAGLHKNGSYNFVFRGVQYVYTVQDRKVVSDYYEYRNGVLWLHLPVQYNKINGWGYRVYNGLGSFRMYFEDGMIKYWEFYDLNNTLAATGEPCYQDQ